MPIRKFGTEPAKTETRAEDNDQETLDSIRRSAAEQKPADRNVGPEIGHDDGSWSRHL